MTSISSSAHKLLEFGGVSGGGGNVISATPPVAPTDSETAEELIKKSRQFVNLYLGQKSEKFQANQMNDQEHILYSKIFAGPKNILNAVEKISPDIEDDGPCYDYENKPVDASIANRPKNKFCISAHSISQKVDHQEIPIQSAALMIHEYSEIVGTTEEEAVTLQTQAIEELKQMDLPPLEH